MKFLIYSFLALLLPLHSCSTIQVMEDNQIHEGHYRLYTYPHKLRVDNYDEERFQKISILGLNDFEGSNEAEVFDIKNRFNEKRKLAIGGISAIKSYIDLFKQHSTQPVLTVDAGSFMVEDFDVNKNLFLYNYLGLDAANLGSNEYFYQSSNSERAPIFRLLSVKLKFPLLNNNITFLSDDTQTQELGILPYTIKEVEGLKVGIIGTLTQAVSSSSAQQKYHQTYIENSAKNIIVSSNSLRKQGVDIVVVLLSRGTNCTAKQAQALGLTESKVNFDPKSSKYCDEKEGNFVETLKLLPPNTIDVVFTSGNKSKVANFIEGIPVLQNKGEGRYLSWIDLYFDKKHKAINHEYTQIHQPIALCHHFFKNTMDCFTDEPFENEEVIPATFLGLPVKLKADISKTN